MKNKLVYVFLFLVISCSDSTYLDDNISCNYNRDIKGIKNGGYICVNSDKVTLDKGYLRDDSLRVDERYIYFTNGNLNFYKFYNIIGELRYLREYSENGDVLKEEGDFFSHMIVSSTKIKLNDSVIIAMHIAKPPDCDFEVFGFNNKGRYKLYSISSDLNFISKHVVKPEKVGVSVFVFEIDFLDKITGKKETRKSEVVIETY